MMASPLSFLLSAFALFSPGESGRIAGELTWPGWSAASTKHDDFVQFVDIEHGRHEAQAEEPQRSPTGRNKRGLFLAGFTCGALVACAGAGAAHHHQHQLRFSAIDNGFHLQQESEQERDPATSSRSRSRSGGSDPPTPSQTVYKLTLDVARANVVWNSDSVVQYAQKVFDRVQMFLNEHEYYRVGTNADVDVSGRDMAGSSSSTALSNVSSKKHLRGRWRRTPRGIMILVGFVPSSDLRSMHASTSAYYNISMVVHHLVVVST